MKHSMKLSLFKTCFIFLSSFSTSTVALAGRAVITGQVTNAKATQVELSYNIAHVGFKEYKQSFQIDKKGNFTLTCDVSARKLVYLVIDEQQTSFYVQPQDSFHLQINYADFDKSLAFSGKGANKNNLYKNYLETFVYEHEQDVFRQNALRKPDHFATYCDSLLQEKLKFINGFTGQVAPEPAFIIEFKNDLVYENACNKLQYSGLWAYLHRKGDTLPEMPDDYFKFVKTLPVNNEALAENEQYLNYTRAVVRHYRDYIATSSGVRLNHQESLELARGLLKNDRLLLTYEADLVYTALGHEDFVPAEAAYYHFVKRNGANIYSEELKDVYTKVKAISPGQPAPAFTLSDLEGKKYSLQDLKGKVVYLDFWASWCGPCLREIPYAKKIKQEFEGKNVIFLYISVDEDETSWKAAVAKHELKGLHLVAPSMDHAVSKAYNIHGVPTYFLIDKTGNIVTNNAPRPSNADELRKALNAALMR